MRSSGVGSAVRRGARGGCGVLAFVMSAALAPTAASAAPSVQSYAAGTVQVFGDPVAGATVVGWAWPDTDTLAGAPDGAQLQPLLLGTATTGPDGRYALSVDPSRIPAGYREPDGTVAIETLTTTPSGTSMLWETSVRWDAAAAGFSNATTGEVVGPATTTAEDLGAGTAENTGADPNDDVSQAVAVAPAAVPAVSAGGCTWSAGAWHKGLPERFLDVDAWKGAPGVVTERDSTTHTLGIGVSDTGSFADLTAGGTMAIDATTVTGHEADSGPLVNTRVADRANYRDFAMWCDGHLMKWRERRPVSMYDYLDSDLFVHIPHTYYYSSCGGKRVGQHWTTSSAHAAAVGGGVDLGPVTVSAQAGYDDSTSVKFTWNQDGYICGDNTLGPLQSSHIDTSPNN